MGEPSGSPVPSTKRCSVCGETKPLSEFPPAKKMRDGHYSWCRSCKRERDRAGYENHKAKRQANMRRYREGNKDRIAERNRIYHETNRARIKEAKRAAYEANPQAVVERVARWRRENPDKARAARKRRYDRHRKELLEKSKAWQHKNRDKVNAARRRWRAANPERFAHRNREHRSRVRARSRGNKVVPVDRLAIYERDGGICHLCGQPSDRKTFCLDHLVPIALGGPHSPENVAVAHRSCNRRRGIKSIEEIRALLSA